MATGNNARLWMLVEIEGRVWLSWTAAVSLTFIFLTSLMQRRYQLPAVSQGKQLHTHTKNTHIGLVGAVADFSSAAQLEQVSVGADLLVLICRSLQRWFSSCKIASRHKKVFFKPQCFCVSFCLTATLKSVRQHRREYLVIPYFNSEHYLCWNVFIIHWNSTLHPMRAHSTMARRVWGLVWSWPAKPCSLACTQLF